jgi:alpha-tubulin suppressor-like RCC1 family protein
MQRLPRCRANERLIKIDSLAGAAGPLLHTRNGDVCARLRGANVGCWRERIVESEGPRVGARPEVAPSVDVSALREVGTVSQFAQSTDVSSTDGSVYGGFACARTEEGKVYCWGMDTHGTLGTLEVEQSARPLLISGLPKVTNVTLGSAHGCALGEDHLVYCWGSNEAGQLGDGRVRVRGEPVAVSLF